MSLESTGFEHHFSEAENAYVIEVDQRVLSSPESSQRLVEILIKIMKSNECVERIIVKTRSSN